VASLPRRPRLLRQLRHVYSPWSAPAIGMPVEAHELRTARLLLRPYRLSDEADWRRIEDDEEVRRGLDWPLRTSRQVRDHLVDRTFHTVLSRPGDLLVLAIEHQGRVIGDVSLHLRTVAPETRVAEIGWLQLTSEGGHGYATEAADALLELAFGELRACLVTAVIDRANTSSARLALRLGFRPAGGTSRFATFVMIASDHAPSRQLRAVSEAPMAGPESVENL
jgi:RimJ/RimL family protein N-acetyltransferase